MPWFLRMCCLLSSCCCMYSNCWLDWCRCSCKSAWLPSRTSVTCWLNGPTAYSTYFGLNAQSCFATWGQTTEKKNARLLQGKRHSLRITCGSTTLISHHPPGFATRICHMSQCAKCPAGCEETAEVAVTLWAVREVPLGNRVWSMVNTSACYTSGEVSHFVSSRGAKSTNSIASLAAKSIVPAALMENVPYQHADCPQAAWHCLSLGETKTVSDNGTTWMPQKHFLASMKNSARTFMAYVLQRVSVCVCVHVRAPCVVEGNTRYNVHAQRERERESLLLRKNCTLWLAFWDIASFQNYVIVLRSYSSQGDTERTNPFADKCDISLVHNCTFVCNATCTDPCQDIILVPSMLNACIARLCLLWGEAIAGR